MGENENYLKVKTLSLEISSESNGLNLTGELPKLDEVGVKEDPYTFTLHNNGDVTSEYTIYLDDVVDEGERLSDSHIKYQLVKDSSQKSLALLSSLNPSPDRILDSGKIEAGASIEYELRLWVDRDADNSAMNKYFKGKLRIEAIQEIETLPPKSFSTDSWATIVAAVKSKNTDLYNVGEEKEIDLGELGTHKVRIANKEEPEECADPNFSQTACGFVLEFTDILFTSGMNPDGTTIGGWEKSRMRAYINNKMAESGWVASYKQYETFYKDFPEDLKRGILTTRVISGYSYLDEKRENFITHDKLYLLSSREVFGGNPLDPDYAASVIHDVAYKNTRQLDYYAPLIVQGDDYDWGFPSSYYHGTAAIKNYQGEPTTWWLRSAYYNYSNSYNSSYTFLAITGTGAYNNFGAGSAQGISPAFRIG